MDDGDISSTQELNDEVNNHDFDSELEGIEGDLIFNSFNQMNPNKLIKRSPIT